MFVSVPPRSSGPEGRTSESLVASILMTIAGVLIASWFVVMARQFIVEVSLAKQPCCCTIMKLLAVLITRTSSFHTLHHIHCHARTPQVTVTAQAAIPWHIGPVLLPVATGMFQTPVNQHKTSFAGRQQQPDKSHCSTQVLSIHLGSCRF